MAWLLRRLVLVAMAAGLVVPIAHAQTVTSPETASPRLQKSAAGPKAVRPQRTAGAVQKRSEQKYFVEFRSRFALSYGHTFVAHGPLNAKGEIASFEVAGLHPRGDSPYPWMAGHLIWVMADTGPSDGDLEEEYISARYRIVLSEAEYAKVSAYIRQRQANTPLWHAVLYNCNAFAGDIARFMGLQTPSSSLLRPADYINKLREVNAGQQHVAMMAAPPARSPAVSATGAGSAEVPTRSGN